MGHWSQKGLRWFWRDLVLAKGSCFKSEFSHSQPDFWSICAHTLLTTRLCLDAICICDEARILCQSWHFVDVS